MNAYPSLPCKSHPLRATLYNELHIRPFPQVGSPQQVTHLAVRAQKADQDRAYDLLCELSRRYGVNLPDPRAVSYLQDFGDFTIQWERHVEFYSVTVLHSINADHSLFESPAIELLPKDWVALLPGEIVCAVNVEVVAADHAVDSETLSRCFEGQRLSVSQVKDGRGVVYTAFRLHGDGFGRILVQNRGMSDEELGRLTRRLLEIETYRLLALLSLPLAKQITPQLSDMDRQLARLLVQLPEMETAIEERDLLKQLSKLAAKLETWRAETNRRFSGTKAYHEMIQDRMARIGEESFDGYQTLGNFMKRRLDPALRTCMSVHGWMDDLSKRIERASDLMRTRVNLTLQEQNKNLLASMDRRSKLQFRLQETVEGLSVVAISYYLVGLLGYLGGGLPLASVGLSKSVVQAALIPPVLFFVWLVIRRIKRHAIRKPARQE